MTLIQVIRENVTAKQAGEMYGLQFDRRGCKALCPWHNDTNPSLSFKGTKCRCFACNNGGDAVDLVAQMLGISLTDAAKKIQGDFGLGVEVDRESLRRLKAQQQARKMAREAARRRYIRLCNIERNSREALEAFDQETAWDNPKFRALLRAFSRAQDELNSWESQV